MQNIAICIPTYKRPLMLKKLLLSINKSKINEKLINNINIIIVDNDVDQSAKATAIELKEFLNHHVKLKYHNYPIKGLSNVRNELLKKAFELRPDFIVFIDDDEYTSIEWLNELVEVIINNNCDMVRGPIISVPDHNISRYISCWFKKPNYQGNSKINSIATNNLIIKTGSLINNNIWFDKRFNYTGAEDSYFGIQMLKKGATIFWASNAVVYETIPKNRANIKWLTKRYFSGANTFIFILKVEKEYLKLTIKFILSMLYIVAGICALIIIPIPIKRKYWGILKLSEGIGGIAGLINIKYYGYK